MHATEDRERIETRIVMLCGIPGSGKSSLAAELQRRLADVELIATDVIGGRRGRYMRLEKRLATLLGQRRYVILDGTFFRREMRERVRGLGYPTLLAYLECPLSICLERNKARGGAVPSAAVIAMQRRFQLPTEAEAPLVIRTDRLSSERAAARVCRLLERPLSPRQSPGSAGGS